MQRLLIIIEVVVLYFIKCVIKWAEDDEFESDL